jgi:hypothetical protein
MTRRDLILLFCCGLLFAGGVAWFQVSPGYMDADYYFAGGLRLVQGHGFTETYLWNYLDNPQSLPHPSHGYWFPLASILAAAGMWLTGAQTFWAGRLGFILVAALVAPLTSVLAYQITQRRDFALAAGFLAVFCGYHAPFMPTTDNFGLFTLFGAIFFIFLPRNQKFAPLLLGLTAGLMNLARSDGLLWLGLGGLGLGLVWLERQPRPRFSALIFPVLLFVAGYALVMGPWMLRNLSIWGTPLTPSGSRVLWMTRYDETFAWPPDRINPANWQAAGLNSALLGRLEALKLNAINTVAAQTAFLLFPFILVGIWQLRKQLQIRLAACAWLILFVVMSLIFPFAGSRGSFFHAAAALQPVWYTAAIVGLDFLVVKARSRGWFTPAAQRLFRFALVAFMAMLTVALAYISVNLNDWNQFRRAYLQVEQKLVENGAKPADVIIVANAPGYYVATGRSAIIVPDENLDSVRALARQFGARYLVLEKTYYTDPMIPIYKNPENQPGLRYLGEFDEIRLFAIQP